MNVPVGNRVELPFYFSKRELTVAEDEHFFDPDREVGQGLPADVGFKPPQAICEYRKGSGAWTTVEGSDVIEDAEGEYRVIVLVPLDGAGVWSYRGRGVDGETPVCSTPVRTFTAS